MIAGFNREWQKTPANAISEFPGSMGRRSKLSKPVEPMELLWNASEGQRFLWIEGLTVTGGLPSLTHSLFPRWRQVAAFGNSILIY